MARYRKIDEFEMPEKGLQAVILEKISNEPDASKFIGIVSNEQGDIFVEDMNLNILPQVIREEAARGRFNREKEYDRGSMRLAGS